MACIRAVKSPQGSTDDLHHKHHKNIHIIQVYTDWANHYLGKCRSTERRMIQDLQTDVSDGVLLADIIEAVTGHVVPNLNPRPKTSAQMLENVKACLSLLVDLGVNVEGLQAEDVRQGNLKTILGVLFALSRQKQKAAAPDMSRKHSGTGIPVAGSRLSSSDTLSVVPSDSRSTSPHSFIPRHSNPASTRVRTPSSGTASPSPGTKSNTSVLKIFSYKEKNTNASTNKTKGNANLSKRTSSSSGFSSARSDSSCSGDPPPCAVQGDGSSPKSRPLRNKLIKIPTPGSPKTRTKPSPKLSRKVGSNKSSTECEAMKTEQSQSKLRTKGSSMSVRAAATVPPPNTNSNSSIPKPTAAVKGTSKPAKEQQQHHTSSPMNKPPVVTVQHHAVPRHGGGSAGISVAMVSPMPSIVTSSENSSSMSESSYSNSTGQSNSNSSDSSVIYRPSSESGSEKGKQATRKIETTFDNLDKVITREAQRLQSRETSFGGEEDATMNVKPMQPLLRGYSGGLTSCMGMQPPRQNIKCWNYTHIDPIAEFNRGMGDGDYGEPEYSNVEVVSGYLSDGDMLRDTRSPDMCDGYMSEGGASLVARRMQHQENWSVASSPARRVASRPKPRPGFDDSGACGANAAQDTFPEDHSHHKGRNVSSEHTQVVYRVVGSRSHVKKSDSSQQTDSSAFRHNSPASPSKRQQQQQQQQQQPLPQQPLSQHHDIVRRESKREALNSNGLPRKCADRQKKMGVKDDGSSSSSKDKEQHGNASEKQPKVDRVTSSSSSSGQRTNGKVRGVPQSFGYVKRSTNAGSGSKGGGELRTAQVSAVPRTKLKVSGGTQTDLHPPPPPPPPPHYKSYSLTGPSASQLSQTVRDRLLLGSQSLPKPGSSEFHSHRGQQRMHRPTDGSLSDTTYSNYAELQNYYANSSPYSSWLRYSAAYTSSLPARASAAGLVEADSVESLCSLPAQLQHHRASLTHARLLMHQRESSASPGPRLNRSNSIRSTKSEKMYPSMLQRSEELDPYYGIPLTGTSGLAHAAAATNHHSSQPTSPTPSQVSQGTPASRFNYSPITTSASSHGLSRISISPYSGLLSKTNSKDDEVHGSSVSLVSTASSLYSTPEEKQSHEIRKLRRELQDAQEKVHTLTNQLSTNAHVVSAFEQSLSNMTQRLQHLTSTAERKDSELLELRQTIELLRKQSVEAGLTSAHIQSMSPSLARRHTINVNAASSTLTPNAGGTNMLRQLSTDSVSSINSLSSACSLSQESSGKKKKKGWLRSSFSKAFSRSKKNKNGSVSDVEDSRGLNSDVSAPSSPLLSAPHHMNGTQIKGSQSSSAAGACRIYDKEPHEARPDVVEELKKQLREKDLVLTDIRLEALSSAHQLESLKDTVIKMRNEMLNLKQDNERLQRIVTSKSLTSSQSSLPIIDSLERRFSMTETSTPPPPDPDGKRVMVSVFLGSHGSYHKYIEEGNTPASCVIASVSLSGKTKWDILDCLIRRAFKEYVLRVDPVSNLGLSAESIWSYHLGEVVRYKDSQVPELLPYGYLVGDNQTINVCLKGALHGGSVDALAFETLIPKSIVQRYVSLLSEHRRIILCGPSGTGKSYLANKLAEFLVLRDGKESTAESIATFNVDHKSSKELRQYLANVAEQCENNASDLPSVIILDNLHHAASLGEVFNGFLNAKYAKCPYIIGTMNQATCSTTNLQLHHNFRWVLCANHMEPVKGFLGRYLRRRLLESEVQEGVRNNDLNRIFDWIPKVWQHLNKFLETHSSSDVTIGPRLFLSCPSDPDGSQVWFTDLWNYSVVPYLLEAVREGLQLYGRRAPWEDPTHFICQTYPWTSDTVQGGQDALLRLRPEDVGYDIQQSSGVGGSSIKSMSSTQSDTDGDPLLNMLMRLQEAANYSSPHSSNDSDAISLDSHPSSIHSDDKVSPRIESTL